MRFKQYLDGNLKKETLGPPLKLRLNFNIYGSIMHIITVAPDTCMPGAQKVD